MTWLTDPVGEYRRWRRDQDKRREANYARALERDARRRAAARAEEDGAPSPWAVDLADRLDRIEWAIFETHEMAFNAARASGMKVPKSRQPRPPAVPRRTSGPEAPR